MSPKCPDVGERKLLKLKVFESDPFYFLLGEAVSTLTIGITFSETFLFSDFTKLVVLICTNAR